MLPDLLQNDLNLVICGTAVGNQSAQMQQYYAKRGNKFWHALFEAGLTPVLLHPAEYEKLLEFKIGLTDLVKRKSGKDKNLKRNDFGRNDLIQKIEQYQPKFLCFNGKRAGKEFHLRPVDYGLQPERIGTTSIYVAPSTSGAANTWWDIQYWVELNRLIL